MFMEKLPRTSYVGMVNIWLIYGQLLPFIQVVLATCIDTYRQEKGSTIPRVVSVWTVSPMVRVEEVGKNCREEMQEKREEVIEREREEERVGEEVTKGGEQTASSLRIGRIKRR